MFTVILLTALALLLTTAVSIPTSLLTLRHSSSTYLKRSVQGPRISADFPDPSLIQVGSTWYSFATNRYGVNVQTAMSPDFESWTVTESDALPMPGAWVDKKNPEIWAPDVVQLLNGSFVLYYSGAVSNNTAFHCVGAATSPTIEGPYTALPAALACPLSTGGAIDPAGFQDADGTLYVVYKVDGNTLGNGGTCNNGVAPLMSTPLMLQKLAADGVTPIGDPVKLLDRDDGDGPLVEAPYLVKSQEGVYFLFFSSNCYTTTLYDVSYATANSITGPYTKAEPPKAPLLVTGDYGLTAPGGASVTSDGTKICFHANVNGGRGMWTGDISLNGTIVSI
ncbi:MAG: hypothetical protein M1827_003615 [Pycnora praestabilis]|nr:MAG: hypothetical protein M1827_003615 [Pycnora praestabilis]